MRTHVKSRRGQRGVTAVFVGLTLALMGMFVAASVNVGQLMWRRNQLQNATDAGALAGARMFNGYMTGINEARIRAAEYTELHLAGRDFVDIDPYTDIEFGEWRPSDGYMPRATPTTDAEARKINAIKVKSDREDNEMDTFFAGLLRATAISVGATATAIGGGPCEGCSFPVAIPACQVVDDNTGQFWCTRHFTFSEDPDDTAGFTSLSLLSTNTNRLRGILDNPNSCADVTIGDEINVSNGNNLVPLESRFAQHIDELVTVPIIDANRSTDGTCAPKFNQDNVVVGFATMRVIAVEAHGPNKRIEIEFVCNPDNSGEVEIGGCGHHFGHTAPQVALVE